LGLAHFEVLEDEIDASVRQALNQLESEGVEFIGEDGARKFAGTRTQALAALQNFIEYQLPLFGTYEDAVHDGEWVLAHSMLSAPMNLGLLDPIEVARAAEAAYYSGHAPLNSVEGFIRQVVGWRDYVWHLYWHFGEQYLDSNFMEATSPLPSSWSNLMANQIEATCLSKTIANVSTNAWTHHIQRLMVLSNFAAQRGINPREFNDWLVDAFVDGTPWVMPANAIGMALFADGGRMSTKPYVSGGAYINKMTNYCGGCRFDPKVRVGENACPLTAGYWNYLATNRSKLRGNHRMGQAYAGLTRITEIDQIIDQERNRNSL
jgi:deoxyribodipyrimidine photolyase-related protein